MKINLTLIILYYNNVHEKARNLLQLVFYFFVMPNIGPIPHWIIKHCYMKSQK